MMRLVPLTTALMLSLTATTAFVLTTSRHHGLVATHAFTNSENWDILMREREEEERYHAVAAAHHVATRPTDATQAAAATAAQIDNLAQQWEEFEQLNRQYTAHEPQDQDQEKNHRQQKRKDDRSSHTLVDMATQWTQRNAETTGLSNSEHRTVPPRQRKVAPRPLGIPPRRSSTWSAASSTTLTPLTPTTSAPPITNSANPATDTTTNTGPVLEYRFDDLDTLDQVQEQATAEILPSTADLADAWKKHQYQQNQQVPEETNKEQKEDPSMMSSVMDLPEQQEQKDIPTPPVTTTSMADLAAQWAQRNREQPTHPVEPSFPTTMAPPSSNQKQASPPPVIPTTMTNTNMLAAEWAQRNQDVVDKSSNMKPTMQASSPPSTTMNTDLAAEWAQRNHGVVDKPGMPPPMTSSYTSTNTAAPPAPSNKAPVWTTQDQMDSLAQQWKSRNADDTTTTSAPLAPPTAFTATPNRMTYDMRGVVLTEHPQQEEEEEQEEVIMEETVFEEETTVVAEEETAMEEEQVVLEEKKEEDDATMSLMNEQEEEEEENDDDEEDAKMSFTEEEEEEEDDEEYTIVSSKPTQIDSFVNKVKSFASFPVERISVNEEEEEMTTVSEKEALELVNQVERMLGESDDDESKEPVKKQEKSTSLWNRKVADALPTNKFAFTMMDFGSEDTLKQHEWANAAAKLTP
eukprot:scaffold43485_cov160-Amphora_coffeaeformis.AAC.1